MGFKLINEDEEVIHETEHEAILVESISIGSYKVPVKFEQDTIVLVFNYKTLRDAEVLEFMKENEEEIDGLPEALAYATNITSPEEELSEVPLETQKEWRDEQEKHNEEVAKEAKEASEKEVEPELDEDGNVVEETEVDPEQVKQDEEGVKARHLAKEEDSKDRRPTPVKSEEEREAAAKEGAPVPETTEVKDTKEVKKDEDKDDKTPVKKAAPVTSAADKKK